MSIAPSSSHQEQSGLPGSGPSGKEDLHYNSHLEELIASEAEKALALRWLHDQSEKRYSQLNTYIAIPVICISTLAGTASIGQDTLFGGDKSAPIVIGLMSLTVSVLNVVSNFFAWAKRSEGHRISSINYGKLHRWISIELALPREQRVPAKHFLKEIRSQIDRLNETSPPIPQTVIDMFQLKMKNVKSNVTLPEICNDLQNVEVYRGKNNEEAEESDSDSVITMESEVPPEDLSSNASAVVAATGLTTEMQTNPMHIASSKSNNRSSSSKHHNKRSSRGSSGK
jgi:hypothetical protein